MKRVLSSFVIALLALSLSAAQTTVPAKTDKVPVIILFASSTGENVERAAVASVGGEVTRAYHIISGVAAHVPTTAVNGLKRNPRVLSVDPDVEVQAADIVANQQVSADDVWAQGYDGSGVRLAILDSGIATSHIEFAGRIVACKTEVVGTTTCEDDQGHGTHAAGIAGAKGIDGRAKGVAPSVLFMVDKVLNSSSKGFFSDIIAGIDWATSNNAQIISMSLGTSPVDGAGTQSNCDSWYPSLTTAINNAVAAGVTVVAAAGNSGTSGLGAPGCISSVIAVAAVDSSDTLASFSSRGVALKDHGVAAPGESLYSTYLNGGYTTMSGTSMATPMVSGTIALMLSKDPKLSPSDIRDILFSNSDCVSGTCPNTNIGYGRINALKAVNHLTPFVNLSFQGYDYDNQGEVSVIVNNQVVTNLPLANAPQNNNLFASYSLDISKYLVADVNSLTFKQNIYSSGVQSVKINNPNGTIYSNSTYYYMQAGTSSQTITYKFSTSSSSPPPSTGTLSVTTTPVNGQVFVDGASWGFAPVSKSIAAGSHTVSYGAVSGYTVPSSVTVSVTAGATTSVTGTYTLINPPPSSSTYILTFQGYDFNNKGEVSVLVNNQLVATLPTAYSSQNAKVYVDFMLNITKYVLKGSNTLTFKQNLYSAGVRNVVIKNATSTVYNNANYYSMQAGTASQSITYRFSTSSSSPPPSTGTLSVTTTPVNGQVFVDGSSWGTAPVSKSIATGSHTVSFGAVSGYTTPASITVSITAGQTTSVTGTYVSTPPSSTYTLTFQGYDYDNKGEVIILVNNQVVTSLPTVETSANNNVFKSFSVDITKYIVAGSTNTITFKQNLYSSGVKDLQVTKSGSTIIYSNTTYHNIWVGGSQQSITYSFYNP